MVTITLYTRQQKRHWCIEQSFGLCGRGREWDDLGEWHWNMYNIIYETSRQSRFDAPYWMLGAGALGRPRGMVRGGRREEDSGWGTHVYLWQIHFDIWQNQCNIVKLNKIKKKKIWKMPSGHCGFNFFVLHLLLDIGPIIPYYSASCCFNKHFLIFYRVSLLFSHWEGGFKYLAHLMCWNRDHFSLNQ